MAKPIKATPILSGKCADKFVERLSTPPTQEKKDFLKKSRKAHEIIDANSK